MEVPREPTKAMCVAGAKWSKGQTACSNPEDEAVAVWKAMLSAAPAAQASEQEIIAGGVEFIMGPRGDEGTKRCTCRQYPHHPMCGQPAPSAGGEER